MSALICPSKLLSDLMILALLTRFQLSRALPFEISSGRYLVRGESDTAVHFEGVNVATALDDILYSLRFSVPAPQSGLRRIYYTSDAMEIATFPRARHLPNYNQIGAIFRDIKSFLGAQPGRSFLPMQAEVLLSGEPVFDFEIRKIPLQSFAVSHGRWTAVCNYYPSRRMAQWVVRQLFARLTAWIGGSSHRLDDLVQQINLPEFVRANSYLDAEFRGPSGQAPWARITYRDLNDIVNQVLAALEQERCWGVLDIAIQTRPTGGQQAARIGIANSELGDIHIVSSR